MRRSNTITSRVPGLSSQDMQSSENLRLGTPRDATLMQKDLENGQKVGWTSKFNSMGSNSSSTMNTANSNAAGSATSQVSICLECKDVVDNIARKNDMGNAINNLHITNQEQKVILRTPKTSNNSLARDMRNLHTQSMIIE